LLRIKHFRVPAVIVNRCLTLAHDPLWFKPIAAIAGGANSASSLRDFVLRIRQGNILSPDKCGHPSICAQGDFTMTDEEKAAADKAEADRKAAEQKAAGDQAAADKKAADDEAAADKAEADRQAAGRQDLERVTTERDTLKGQLTAVTAERDAAVKERDAFKAEVDRLSKLVGKTSTPPAGGGGGKGKQTAEEWLKEQVGK
jgi:hypothetical protein